MATSSKLLLHSGFHMKILHAFIFSHIKQLGKLSFHITSLHISLRYYLKTKGRWQNNVMNNLHNLLIILLHLSRSSLELILHKRGTVLCCILPVTNHSFFRLQLSDLVHRDVHAMERPESPSNPFRKRD